jgi:hypothetical protein
MPSCSSVLNTDQLLRVWSVYLARSERLCPIRIVGILVPHKASSHDIVSADDAGRRLCSIVVVDSPLMTRRPLAMTGGEVE